MMTTCIVCGSNEIVPDLWAFTHVGSDMDTVFISLDPPKGRGKPVELGLRVAVCTKCGHAEFYTRYPADLLEAHKKGYKSPK
jgi:predicted nucleic-acid-binding Zn-ribbon protein